MAAKRLRMRQLREILRLTFEAGLPHRAIARSCSIGLGTVSEYLVSFRQSCVTGGTGGAARPLARARRWSAGAAERRDGGRIAGRDEVRRD